MTRGRINVVGNIGMHLGAYMKGGTIEVSGDASDWVGGEMTDGLIHIRGNAGGQAGAAYRGSLAGMRGGAILIEGTAGLELGSRMKRGVIAVKGLVKDFAGLQMKGGTIFLLGGAEIRSGRLDDPGHHRLARPDPPLAYLHLCLRYNPTYLRLYARQLSVWILDSICQSARGVSPLYGGRLRSGQRRTAFVAGACVDLRFFHESTFHWLTQLIE